MTSQSAKAPRKITEALWLFAILAVMGAGWGMTQPLAKIAVSEGYRAFGLIAWQLAVGALATGAVLAVRGRRPRFDAPALRVYLVIALIGTVLPNSASFEAARHLPAGLLSILLSLVPMFAFPMALALGNERFAWGRFAGLLLGLTGVLIIVAPDASLPDRAMIVFIPVALIAPIFYGLEGNVVARWGTAGLGPIEVLFGASLIGAAIAFPLAFATGTYIDPLVAWRGPEWAILGSSLIHVTVYTTYVWLVGRAGPVFAVQVSYLVTLFGVTWSILILNESYSGWIWAAMVIIMAGVFLVQPRPGSSLDGRAKSGQPSET